MKLSVHALAISEVKVIEVPRFEDGRGYFCETFSQPDFEIGGLDRDFIQDNESYSARAGTVRGLHYQREPYAQAKLIRVPRGRIFDVAVDLRPGSPTYRRHVHVELSDLNGKQLLVPRGFAHGFCTLVPNTTVLYKVDNPYAPSHEAGINWADPELAIPWPVSAGQAILSDKDKRLPRLNELSAAYA